MNSRAIRRWIYRRPIIRHVRAWLYWRQLQQHLDAWSFIGLPVPQESDVAFIRAVWQGRCVWPTDEVKP